MTSLSDVKFIELPKFEDPRGNLSVIEELKQIPFTVPRAYWIYDVPGGQFRGGHSYKKLEEFVIAISGSFDLLLEDGYERKKFSLNRSYHGVYVPNGIWRRLDNFSTNALCLILASLPYDENDYLFDFDEFLRTKRNVK